MLHAVLFAAAADVVVDAVVIVAVAGVVPVAEVAAATESAFAPVLASV